MPRAIKSDPVYRILDANINRAKEGLRVCEEVARFVLESRALTSRIKAARHAVSSAAAKIPAARELLKERASLSDVGKDVYLKELSRKSLKDIFFANIQRSKESVRVLEEFSKLISKRAAREFKALRYEIYEIEKIIAGKIASL